MVMMQKERSTSPIMIDKKNVPNGPKALSNGMGKIYRIPLVGTARVQVTYVESPNLFWVRPFNHITDQLQLPNDQVTKLTLLNRRTPSSYIMAPYNSSTYARARIMKIQKTINDDLAFLVIFLDDGTRAWIKATTAAQMPAELYYHPWQAIACSLFKILPPFCGQGRSKWSVEENETFRRIVQQFDRFKVSAVQSRSRSNDAGQPVKVELFGLKNGEEEDGTGICLAHSLALQLYRRCEFDLNMFDGNQMNPQPETEIEAWEEKPPEEFERWRSVWSISEKEMKDEDEVAVKGTGMENAGEVFVSIPIVTMAWLRDEENGFEWRGEFLIHVEGRHTVSPYEFYGRLLKYETTTARLQLEGVGEGEEEHLLEGNMIVAANDRLIHFAGELNAFYGQKKNRQQIEAEATKRALSNGQRIYGIVEVEDDRAEFTGLWQRVQILGLCQQSRFARIRYLDSGGSDIRPLSSVLRIYPAHCQRAPFCIQFCYHGVRPMRPAFQSTSHLDQLTWSQQAIMKFRQLMREDVPISLSLWGRLNKCHENEPYEYNTPPWRLPDVMFVMSAKARGMDKNINSLMLEPPGGIPIAVKDDSMPVPSPIDLAS